MVKIGVLGAGTWGIALARMLSKAGHQVQVWSPSPAKVEHLFVNRQLRNLPNVIIPIDVKLTEEIDEACRNKDILINAVSSVYV